MLDAAQSAPTEGRRAETMTHDEVEQLQTALGRLQRETHTLKRVLWAVLCTDFVLLAVWVVRAYWARFSIH
jgi:hypothetical protein